MNRVYLHTWEGIHQIEGTGQEQRGTFKRDHQPVKDSAKAMGRPHGEDRQLGLVAEDACRYVAHRVRVSKLTVAVT